MKTLRLIYLWVKEFFIPCRLRKRFWDDKPFLICGHRGSPNKFPENTIESFEQAVKDGVNSIEFDLCVTKDEEIIIWHDWNLNDFSSILRANGFEPGVKFKPVFPDILETQETINEFSLEEVRKLFKYADKDTGEIFQVKIPTLKDFFIWSKDRIQLLNVFLDLKIPSDKINLVEIFMNNLERLLEEFKPSFKIVIETYHKEIIKKLNKDYPEYSTALDVEPPLGFIFLPRLHSAISTAIKNGSNYGVSIKPRQITIGNWTTHRRIINYDVRKRVRFNKKDPDKKIEYLISCTINETSEMECLIKLGIGGIQTDSPELLKQIAERMGRI